MYCENMETILYVFWLISGIVMAGFGGANLRKAIDDGSKALIALTVICLLLAVLLVALSGYALTI